MSTLKMQESVPDNELSQLRKQATHKDNRYATLESELLKKNNDLLKVKGTLDETLYKLRNEADRVLKLEVNLNQRTEDLRAERLTRQNMETLFKSTSEKLASEELASKHLQMELENYASRTASQHESELKCLQHEKTILESRVRALESQSQATKPAQPPTRLPRPTTFPAAASTVSDARIATLECELFRAERELADASRALTIAHHDATKVPRLQADLIAAQNAQMRAEKAMKGEKAVAESAQEALREREEELEYWRSAAGDKSLDEGKLEDAMRERDEAVAREGEVRRREAVMRRRMEDMEEKGAELAREREEALDALHRFQVESPSRSSPEDASTLSDLRAALAERDTALTNAREYAMELQQMYRDTLAACDAAEARVRAFEDSNPNPKNTTLEPPLIIVSPPTSPTPAAPFLAQALAQPMLMMSPEDEAVVSRLLSAIERLRGERDSLRRDLHFARVEYRVTNDSLRGQVEATESELRRLQGFATAHTDKVSAESDTTMRRLSDELEVWQRKVEAVETELATRSVDLEVCNSEMEMMRVHVREVEETREMMSASQVKAARMALSSLVTIQYLQARLEVVDASRHDLLQTRDELIQTRNTLAQDHEDLARTCEKLTRDEGEHAQARDQAGAHLSAVIHARDAAMHAQEILNDKLAASDARLSDALKATAERDVQVADMRTELLGLHTDAGALKCELAEARDELSAAEARHSSQQLIALSSADGGAADALRAQLQVLEDRVLRRTEQIGEHQHSIKRLETNLRVAEDTIGELTEELDTISRERACLLEDCAQAREARDEAHKKVEELEVEIETLTKETDELREIKTLLQDAEAEFATSEERVEVMVHVVAESAGRSKALGAALTRNATRLTTIEGDLLAAEASYSQARTEVERLASESEATASMLDQKTVEVEALTHELGMAKDKIYRVSAAFESFKSDVQSREQDVSGQTRHLTATIEELEGRLAVAQTSEEAICEELKATRQNETELRAQLETVQEESHVIAAAAEKLSSTVASLEEALEAGRLLQFEALSQAHEDFERRTTELEAQVEESRRYHASLEAQHAEIVQDLTVKSEELTSRLAEARARAASLESLEIDIRRLTAEHADEVLVLRSRLEESASHTTSLQAQLQAATETITEFESDIEASIQRYDAAQVEIRGLEHALAGARAQLDEHDASIQALHREKTALQIEFTRLEAELERSTTRHQYVEQQAKRSDHEVTILKSEVERLRSEAVKLDEVAQTAEVNLSFKTVQFEQKLALMQRELKKQQEHRQCQENIAELQEKNEYLEEMLRMKSVEIEENDDRFIDALKEKKRLNSKVENLTRKVQNLQTKLAAVPTTPTPLLTTPVAVPASRPKIPCSPVLSSIPSAGPSTRPPTRIPSSPGAALRSRTPEPSRRAFTSRPATPEPPVPPFPPMFNAKTSDASAPRPISRVDVRRPVETATSHAMPPAAPSTPLSSASRKRRAPEDFDSPAPVPAQAVIAPSRNSTPRNLRRPTNEGRSSGFTPTRNGTAAPPRPSLPHPSPLRRTTAPLAETTNSPKGNRNLGLGKPAAISKQPMRSWLSRSRAPTTLGLDPRAPSVLGVQP